MNTILTAYIDLKKPESNSVVQKVEALRSGFFEGVQGGGHGKVGKGQKTEAGCYGCKKKVGGRVVAAGSLISWAMP